MQNIKVGCIPVRQAICIDTKLARIKRIINKNRFVLFIGGISAILFSIYAVLIINFINLIKIMY